MTILETLELLAQYLFCLHFSYLSDARENDFKLRPALAWSLFGLKSKFQADCLFRSYRHKMLGSVLHVQGPEMPQAGRPAQLKEELTRKKVQDIFHNIA